MNKFFTYILAAALMAAATLGACTAEFDDSAAEPQFGLSYNSDGTMNVVINLDIPAMNIPTRALGDTPDYEQIKLYMLVFEEGEGLEQYARLTAEPYQNDSQHGHDQLMTFRAKLNPTEKPAIVHLIATNQPDFEQMVGFGMEERVISALYTSDGHEAYWQRLVLGSNIPSAEQAQKELNDEKYNTDDEKKAQAITALMNHVPMIRNFSRVSVRVAPNAVENGHTFSLLGLYVLNTVDRGSVAPYVAGNDDGQRFVKYYKEDSGGSGTPFEGLSYKDVSDQNHIGTLPAGVLLTNTEPDETVITSKSEADNGNVQPVYFYERPARTNSTERTYVILKGKFDDSTSYYKLDLGYIDEEFKDEKNNNAIVGRFAYYNLLRNFDYAIRLNSIAAAGYGSMADAARGAVFNNFSAAIEARNMKSISDGDDMIFVSFTSYVFTQPNETVRLEAQFRTQIGNGSGGIENNDLLHYKLDEGDIISSIVDTLHHKNPPALDAWNTYDVTGNVPTNRLAQQTLYIYRGNKAAAGQPAQYGLYRIVTFFSHEPWSFVHIDTFPGLWESLDDMPSWEWSKESREIGQSKGSPLTLFFELPAGLPQALFPLKFIIESDRQNIQNAYQGNAVVRSVPAKESLFYNENASSGNPTTTRIQYEKTVTWENYNGERSEELVGTGSAIVRCRFLTITDLSQDGIGGSGTTGSSTTNLRVYNEYFGQKNTDGTWTMYHQDSFTRDTKTSDPSPRFWNFSSAFWDELFLEMKNGDRTQWTENSDIKVDELQFIENSERSLSNDTDGNDMRYVQTSNSNDKLRHTHTYDGNNERTIRLEVMSTNTGGDSTPPKITLTSTPANAMTSPSTYTKTDDSDIYTKYIYDIEVPTKVTKVVIDISQPTANTSMRFYKIDFWPRWDEFEN